MSDGTTEIPKANIADDIRPSWIPIQNTDGTHRKPIIRCNCGELIGLAAHHVHADGTVTASFFDSNQPFQWKGQTVHNPNGCNWHVMLRLKDYDLGDFPPEP